MKSTMRADEPLESSNGEAKLRILIVEDDADTADSMAILLRMFTFDVQVATDGAAALRTALEKQPDVILLDIGLPKLDGWQLAEQIRSHVTGKRPLLIALSGYGMQADQLRSQQAGIDLHFVKPVDPEVLRGVLQRFKAVAMPAADECPAI
ncbi:MAG TPA: response regulator [Gemmataceae bacterium]|nr:response regulator [Gemmataceae bacterium]